MIRGFDQLAPLPTALDLLAPAVIGDAGPSKKPTPLPPPHKPPKMLTLADQRPHTMKVKGKSNANAIVVSNKSRPPCTDSMVAHMGRFRGDPQGMYYGADPAVKECDIMKRPDNLYGWIHTPLRDA